MNMAKRFDVEGERTVLIGTMQQVVAEIEGLKLSDVDVIVTIERIGYAEEYDEITGATKITNKM